MEKIKFKNSRKYKGIVQKVYVKDGQPVKKDELLAEISTQLEKVQIKSPIEGIVKNVYIIESLIVSHNDPVFDIINQAELKGIIKKPSKINDTLKEALVEFGHLDSLISDYNSSKDINNEPDYTVEEIISKRKEQLLEKHYESDEQEVEAKSIQQEDNYLSKNFNNLYSNSTEAQNELEEESKIFEDSIGDFTIEKEEIELVTDDQTEELKEMPFFEEEQDINLEQTNTIELEEKSEQIQVEEEPTIFEDPINQLEEKQEEIIDLKVEQIEEFEEPQPIIEEFEEQKQEQKIECSLPKQPSFINNEEIKNIEPIKEESSENLIVSSIDNKNYKEIDFKSHNLNSTSHLDFQIDITGLMNLYTLMYEPLMQESIDLKLNVFFIKALFKTIAKFDVIDEKTISFSSKYSDQIITKELNINKEIDLKQLAKLIENQDSIDKLGKISLIDLSDFDIYNSKLCLQKDQLLQISISSPQRKIVDEITVINYVNINLTFNNNSLNLSDAIKFITEFNNIIKNPGFLI